jgi:hypothetical protein
VGKTAKQPKQFQQLIAEMKQGQKRKRLLRELCSAPWTDVVMEGRPYAPKAPCRCGKCKGRRKWPSPLVVGGINFECAVEQGLVVLGDEPTPDRHKPVDRVIAFLSGLSQHRPREKRPAYERVPGCEGCGAMRPKGMRFCGKCRRVEVRAMIQSGYLAPIRLPGPRVQAEQYRQAG